MLLAALPLLLAPLQDSAAAPAEPASPAPATVVDFDVRGVRAEDPPPTVPFGPQAKNFRSELLLLRRIAADPDVDGVRLNLEGNLDYARTLDLIHELRAVQAAGKKIVAYAETLDKHDLRVAALCDYIAVPPSGAIVLEAPVVEAFYLKSLLSKLGIEMEVLHVGAYKTAFEEMARESMSAEQRETIHALLQEFYGETANAIAEGRGLSRPQVDALFERVIVPPAEAAAAGLIDAVVYEDQYDQAVRELFGKPVCRRKNYGQEGQEDLEEMMSNPFAMMANLAKLLEPPKPELPAGPRVAVVYATGPITSGESRIGFDGSVASMGSDTIVEALEEALADEDVKAVVLRVNSPGGSATASDMIWRAIQRVRAEKPVVASMGTVAASGGYWISMGCDRIVAQPSTITGSIGVVSAMPDFSGTLSKIGIKVEVVGYGPKAEELSTLAGGPSEFMKGRVNDWMQGVYGEFLDKAAAGRGMPREQLEPLAHGRVWTGRQALENGLVDALGGYEDALALACELGGGLDPASVPLLELPHPKTIFEQLEEMFEGGVTVRAALGPVAARVLPPEVLATAQCLLAGADTLGPDRVQCLLPFALRVH